MKYGAIGLNIILFIVAVYLLLTEGISSGGYIFVWLLIIGCPVVNLAVLLIRSKEGCHWLESYFRRKRLEEERRIEALENGDN